MCLKAMIICGAGHSGSTLLGLILGSHPSCVYVGEAKKVQFLDRKDAPTRKRVCKLCGSNCPVWSDFHWDRDNGLYEQISHATGASCVVDSTKNIGWINARLRELRDPDKEALLIFLVRDGRAVINSRLRKYPDKDPDILIQNWLDQLEETHALLNDHPGKQIIVRYEELATNPEKVVREICGVGQIAYHPEMLEFYRHEHHPLGGNNGTQFLVARAQYDDPDQAFVRLGERSNQYYATHTTGITLDLRWKTEMKPEHLERFEELAGGINREMRWES